MDDSFFDLKIDGSSYRNVASCHQGKLRGATWLAESRLRGRYLAGGRCQTGDLERRAEPTGSERCGVPVCAVATYRHERGSFYSSRLSPLLTSCLSVRRGWPFISKACAGVLAFAIGGASARPAAA